VRISQLCPDRLERLVRYVARGPICNDRLELDGDGMVIYKFKREWKNGARAVVLSPTAFLERLCALIPRPRRPLITYHGVLAPAARIRPAIVPTPEPLDPSCSHEPKSRASNPKPKPPKRRGQRRYYSWAELIRRVFLTDVLVCPRCNGRRRVLAAITDPAVIRRILEHLSLPTDNANCTSRFRASLLCGDHASVPSVAWQALGAVENVPCRRPRRVHCPATNRRDASVAARMDGQGLPHDQRVARAVGRP
jgi:hypothetical protein